MQKLRLKDVAVGVFQMLATDSELLDLMEVPSASLLDIRNQIIEGKYPSDLVANSNTRLCVYELPTSKSIFTVVEKCFIQIDIYVTKDKNKIDRRILLIANRLFQLLNKKNIEGFNVSYYNRIPDMPTDSKEWIKYGIIFSYDNFII